LHIAELGITVHNQSPQNPIPSLAAYTPLRARVDSLLECYLREFMFLA
jgi:hypothetical protein